MGPDYLVASEVPRPQPHRVSVDARAVCSRWLHFEADYLRNVWRWMKEYISRKDPMGRLSGLKLREAVEEAWHAVPKEFLWRLIKSMPKRVEKVIEMNGELCGY